MSEYIIEVDYDIRNGTFAQKRKEEITRCRDCKYCEPIGYRRIDGAESANRRAHGCE